MPASATRVPPVTTQRAPILSVSAPATGIISAAPRPCGIISSPVCSGLRPRTISRYSGSSRATPNSAMPTIRLAAAPAANPRLRSSLRSISGLGTRSAYQQNAATMASPAAIAIPGSAPPAVPVPILASP